MTTILEKLKTEKRTHARLSDFIKIKHGYAFKGEFFSSRPTKDVLVTPGNFAIGGGFKAEKYKYYSGPLPEDYLLDAGDLVVTMTDLSVNADTLGYSALIPKIDGIKFWHNQRVGLVQKLKDEIDLGFLYNLMRTREYQSYVVGGASGSTVKHTSPDRITSFEYDFPSLQTQKEVARILNSYDEKIENNNLIIKNLETSAQTLFDEWFLKFKFPGHNKAELVESELGEIPRGWTVKPLDQTANFLNGIALQKFPALPGEESLPVIKIREMNSGVSAASERASKNIDPKYVIKNGDVLFSWSGSLELMVWSEGDGALNQHIFKVTSDSFDKWFYFFWIRKHLQNFRAIASGKATTMGHIQRHHLSESLVLIPDNKLLKQAGLVISPMFDRVLEIQLENIRLKRSRDLLLAELI